MSKHSITFAILVLDFQARLKMGLMSKIIVLWRWWNSIMKTTLQFNKWNIKLYNCTFLMKQIDGCYSFFQKKILVWLKIWHHDHMDIARELCKYLTCCSVKDLGLKEYAWVLIADAREEQSLSLHRTTRYDNLKNTVKYFNPKGIQYFSLRQYILQENPKKSAAVLTNTEMML